MTLTFGKFVRKTIEDRHLSARRVARASGIDPSFFSKILSGKRSPPSDEKVLKRLARALGEDTVYLVFLAGRIPEEFRELFLNENFIDSLRRVRQGGSTGPRQMPANSKQPARSAQEDVPAARARYENPPVEESRGAPRTRPEPVREDLSEDLL